VINLDANIIEMENKLRGYYQKVEELKVKQNDLKILEKNIEEIKLILSDATELIPSRGMIATYKVTVGTSRGISDPTVQAYNDYEKSIEQFQRNLVILLQKKINLKMDIMNLESVIEGITFALDLLDPLDRTICEQYYGLKRKSNLQIGLALNMDEKSIRYRRKNINNKLIKYLKVSK
jgi:uncharacterized protein YccT (UPF0319 family)